MAYYTSAGVYVTERDESTYIAGTATSVSYIVLRYTYKGPEMIPMLITNEGDLIDTFGSPLNSRTDINGDTENISSCYRDMLSSLGYLKHGISLYATRVLPEDATFAGTMLTSAGSFTQFDETSALTLATEVYTSGDISDLDDFHNESTVINEIASNNDDLWIIAKDRGYWGNNIRVGIVDYDTQTAILSGGTPDGWAGTDGTFYSIVGGIDSKLKNDKELLMVVQESSDNGETWGTVEVWNASLDENATDSQGLNKFVEEVINNGSSVIRVAVSSSNKGADTNAPNVPSEWITEEFKQFSGGSDYISDDLEDDIIVEALELIEDKEAYNINIIIDSDNSETVKSKMVTIAEDRMDTIAILDCKRSHVVNNKGNEASDITQWRKGIVSPGLNINSSYAALYGNWIEVYDKYNQKYRWIPTSGYMAGIYAYTDQVTDSWFAPAGLNRGQIDNVRRLAWNPNLSNRNSLYINGINPIVSFAGKGKVVWGQKTMLDEASAFDRVNVRRLFMTVEKSVAASSQYFVFQPNDRDTRRLLVSIIDPFLADIRARKGLYDYLVVCNTTNNTSERIDRNELWCDVYLKPTKAAEFVVLNFIATRTGVEFTEV